MDGKIGLSVYDRDNNRMDEVVLENDKELISQWSRWFEKVFRGRGKGEVRIEITRFIMVKQLKELIK